MLKSTHKAAPPLPEGWTEHKAPSGHTYYYNASTKKSTYTRPVVAPEEPEELLIDYNATKPDATLHATAQALDEFERNRDPRGQSHFRGGKSYEHDRPRRSHGGDKPKTKRVIPNAEPWVLVKTKYGRRFVHNTETKQSLWKFPQEVMMAVIEMERIEWEEKKAAERREEDEKDPEATKGRDAVAKANAAHQQQREEESGESDDYEEVEVTDDDGDEGASKRLRLEESAPEQPTGPMELNEDDIEWQLAQMEQDDDYGDDYPNDEEEEGEEDGLPITAEDNIALFRSLLDDANISPYTVFDKIIEDTTLVEDPRYTSLSNMHARRSAFTDWSRDRISAIQETQKAAHDQNQTKQIDPKTVYLRFLHTHATPKLYWPEFKRKYRKEAEMKDYEISDKDREKMYRELVSKLKMGESDRRKELLSLLKGVKAELGRDSKLDDMPDSVVKDVRFYVVDEKRRDELVEGFLGTL